MCFGDAKTNTTNTVTQPIINPAVNSAATQSLQQAQNLSNTGYTPYGGERVAPFSPLQEGGFDVASQYLGAQTGAPDIAGFYKNYATAPGPSVNAPPIWTQMGPYMNQYVQQALAPQLEQQNQQFAQQNKALDATATGSGAFGDARAGVEAANLTNQQNIARTGLIGQAYNNAFNTAIGAGAQDVSNILNTNLANANLYNSALGRLLTGGQALQQFYPSLIQTGLGTGGVQQQQRQAQLNVPYSNYLAAQQWPFLTSQNLNAAIAAGSGALPAGQQSTSTTTQPNNSGWSLLGAVAPSLFNGGIGGFGNSAIGQGLGWLGGGLGSMGGGLSSALGGFLGDAGLAGAGAVGSEFLAAAPLMFSDERVKEDIVPVGKLNDNETNVVAFRYKGSPVTMLGVIAQDVEEDYPEVVHEIAGVKAVDYDRLTKLANSFGLAA